MEVRDKVNTEVSPVILTLTTYRSTKLQTMPAGMALWTPAKSFTILLDVTMIHGKTETQQMWTAQRENTYLTVAEKIYQVKKYLICVL